MTLGVLGLIWGGITSGWRSMVFGPRKYPCIGWASVGLALENDGHLYTQALTVETPLWSLD
jgi:hypothetical protein